MALTRTKEFNYIPIPKASKLILKDALKEQHIPFKFINIEDTDEDVPCTCTYKNTTLNYDQVTILYAPLLVEEVHAFLENRFTD